MPHPNSPQHAGISSRKAPGSLKGPHPAALTCPGPSLPSPSCLTGYINHSLSVFYTKDFQDPVQIEGSENVTECRFGSPDAL